LNSAERFRALAALGLSTEQIAGVLDLMDAEAKALVDADEARKAKGRERWHRWQNKREPNVSKRLQTLANDSREGIARGLDNLPTEKISGNKEGKKDTSPAARSHRGTRIPDDFSPDIEAAVADGVQRQDAERQAANFCDYWRAKPGKEGLKLDWPATWRVWYRRNITQAPRAAAPPAPHQGDGYNAVLNRIINGESDAAHTGPTIVAGYERTDRGGAANLVQLHALPARNRP